MALLLVMATASATRIALIVSNVEYVSHSTVDLCLALLYGILIDIFVAAWMLFPFGLFLTIIPRSLIEKRQWYWGILAGFGISAFLLLYLGIVEFYFFDEYNSRFNSVAVEYLSFPHEILSNIWVSYPVLPVLAGVAVVSLAIVYLIRKPLKGATAQPEERKKGIAILGIQAAIMLLSLSPVASHCGHLSRNRIVNEITMNGYYTFLCAARTYNVIFDEQYAHVDDTVAFTRIRQRLHSDETEYSDRAGTLSIDRTIHATGPTRRLNVVIILEESFGSIFVKSLTPDSPFSTPNFESLADSGLLFTQIYATGTRTVRGLEATLLSLPPVPGQSILRRSEGRNLFTLPSLLRSLGYQTTFIYAGNANYDNMHDFMLDNGISEVMDLSGTVFKKRTHQTLWGLCDEDLFDNSFDVFDSLAAQGQPFFTLMLTVSNHSPFTYPKGRIAEDPDECKRENVVKYADFALGRFLEDARTHPFFDSTIFVILGDHGPKVVGEAQIPTKSYRIPVLFYGPKVIPQGVRDSVLGSQMDVAPTIMGILNQTYQSQFFGDDLLKLPKSSRRALVSLNRDIGFLSSDQLVVMGVNQAVTIWERDSSTGRFTIPGASREAEKDTDAISYYQAACRFLDEHKRQLRQ